MIALALLLLTAPQARNGDQQLLDRISMSCGLSAGDIRIKQEKFVRIRPRLTPSYEAIICVLPKLNKAGFSLPVGFISEPPKENH